jgi:hypothetical protein
VRLARRHRRRRPDLLAVRSDDAQRRPGHAADPGDRLEGVVTFQGRQDNLAIREAAIIALAFNVFMVLVAIMAIMLTVPKGKRAIDTEKA